ncbi:MAG TPA: hypothetical protein VE779_11120, partial [Candidatus Angelobacter sp.]|nr:hypothetical protein [Candidatus Angelobacter sp.]
MTFATNNFLPIPTPDPMPLPGPVWLLLTLLLLTFLLHLLAMNLTVGGTLIALVCARQRKRDGFAAQLATSLLQILPTSLAFTITLGVAALLFVQVLYGNLLYASSILIAAFWFAVIPTVMLAYYGLYCAKSRPSKLAPPVVSFLLLLGIGFVYVNNMTLMLSPQRWLSLYRHDASGWNLNWSEPTLAPRYLHMMLGAVAIAGFCIFAAGVWKRSTDYGQWMLRQGSRWFVAPTIVNYVVGMWFLMALPRPVLIDLFTSGPLAAILIGMGMLLPLAAVVHVVLAARTEKTRLHARLAVVTTLLTMIVMVVLRQVVRTAYVDPFLRLRELPVQPQWSV